MPVDAQFFAAIVAGYATACMAWLAAARWIPGFPPDEPPQDQPNRPWLDIFIAVLVVAGIFALGQAYRAGWLLPESSRRWNPLIFNLNALIWYLPLFVGLLARRQPTSTIYLRPAGLHKKIFAGVAIAAASVAAYLAVMGQLPNYGQVLQGTFERRSLQHALPVFLEGAVIAYVFVRLRWLGGTWLAILLPSLLFAAAHIPRGLAAGQPVAHIAAYFALTGGITVIVLLTLIRSRDIVWLGIVHYVMDVAIGAFD